MAHSGDNDRGTPAEVISGQKSPVSDKEWSVAEAFFQQNPDETKLSKKKGATQLNHSFIKVNGMIYAVEPGHSYLGEGGFGKVKKCYNQKGETLAVKVQLGELKDAASEKVGLAALGRLKGVAKRKRDRPKAGKQSRKKYTNQVYLVQDLINGKDLYSYFEQNENTISNAKMADIAYQCAQQLLNFHDAGFGHFDVASRNFMIDEDDKVYLVDFGNAKFLKPEEGTSIQSAMVNINNMPPIGNLGMMGMMKYLLSRFEEDDIPLHETLDVVCFAQMLDDMGIELPLEGLQDEDPLKRPTMDQVVAALRDYRATFKEELGASQSLASEDATDELEEDETIVLDVSEPDDDIGDLQRLVETYLPEMISRFFYYKTPKPAPQTRTPEADTPQPEAEATSKRRTKKPVLNSPRSDYGTPPAHPKEQTPDRPAKSLVRKNSKP